MADNFKKKTSKNRRLGYYRAVVLPKVAKAEKMELNMAHEYVKFMFFSGYSTSSVSEKEFDEIMANIRYYYSKKRVWIPRPNESDLPPNL